jgi:hypothetical protein
MRYLLFVLLIFLFVNSIEAPSLGYDNTSIFKRYETILNKFEIENKIKLLENSEFSPSNLKEYLELLEVKNSDIIIRQSILETGWFKHERCTKYNNYFGMRPAKIRDHTQDGVWRNHATYAHWTDSVKDYLLWRKYYEDIGYNTNNYYAFLNNVGYATATSYTDTLKRINLNRLT